MGRERSELDAVDLEILEVVGREGPLTISSLASLLGWSRSMVWRRVRILAEKGLLITRRMGRVVIVSHIEPKEPPVAIKVGILRASEYPYILPFIKRLRERYSKVDLLVYDEAFKLALDLAAGKVHLAMAPAVSLILAHRASGGSVKIIGGGSAGGAGVAYSRSGGEGHATTMASTMELCAELKRLEPPRIYMRSGGAILAAVQSGKVAAGVIWEPYLHMAKRQGLKVEECIEAPFCCLLGAHKSLEPHYDDLSREIAEAVDETRRGRVDLSEYARIIGMPYELVKATVPSYRFLEHPPVGELKRLWDRIAATIAPRITIENLIHKHI